MRVFRHFLVSGTWADKVEIPKIERGSVISEMESQ